MTQERLQWTEAGCPAPKQVKSKKVMELVFWDEKRSLFIDYLEEGETIEFRYYSNLLDQLSEIIRKIYLI